MYRISKISGKEYINDIEIPKDDRNQLYVDRCVFLENGGEFVYFEGATPEEIAEANKPKVQNLKKQQYIELSETDWYYTRFLETGQEVPLEIKQQRQEIRDKYDTLIQEINNE